MSDEWQRLAETRKIAEYWIARCSRAEKQLEQHKWISCEDKLPETSGRYFVYTENIAGYNPLKNREFIADFFGGEWIFTGWEYNRVTHWLPLPQKPESEDAE